MSPHGSAPAHVVLRHTAECARVHADLLRADGGDARTIAHHESQARAFDRLANGAVLAVVQSEARSSMEGFAPYRTENGLLAAGDAAAEMIGNVYARVVRDHGSVAG